MLRHLPKGVLGWPFVRRYIGTAPTIDSELSMHGLVNTFSALSEIPLIYKDKQAALKRISELCQQAMGSQSCILTLMDFENDVLANWACTSRDKKLENFMNSRFALKMRRGKDGHLDRELMRAGERVERYNLLHSGGGIANPAVARRYNLRAGLCHPLKSDSQLFGYLSHFSSKRGKFTLHEKNLLKIFADQSVNVIEKVEQDQTRDRLSKILNELSTALLSLPPHEFLNRVAETACELLTVPVCIVWTLDTGVDRLKVAAATANVDDEYRKIELSREQFREWSHLFKGKVAYLKNVTKPHALYFHSEEAATREWVSLLSAPLQAEERLIGMLDVYTENQPRSFKAWELEIFYVFANYAAFAMQRARLQEMQLVSEIKETIDRRSGNQRRESRPGNEFEDTLNRIVEQGATATQSRTCYLRLLNRATNQL